MKDCGYTAQNKRDGSLYLRKCGLHRDRWKVEKWISELPNFAHDPNRDEVRLVKCEVSPQKRKKR